MANINNVNVNKIKSLTKEQGTTMKYLCDCLGKRKSFLSDVRLKVDTIDEAELLVIANKLNTTIEYLTDKTEQKEKPVMLNDERGEKIKFINDYADTLNDEELEEFEKLIDSLQTNQIDVRKVSKISRFVSDAESE